MKVVLFCGGFGMRLREYSDAIPKPLVCIGHRPILWHVMRYYSHFGYNEFILCLGWKGEDIKKYFLNYEETLSNDFVMTNGGSKVQLLRSDIQDWKITFADTGLASNIGQRLKAVQKYLQGEETFLANYTDGLTNLHLPDIIRFHQDHNAVASFISVKPTQSFHCVSATESGEVESIVPVNESTVRMNAGFFVLSHQIFDYIHEGEELVLEPFQRLIQKNKLFAMPFDGFYGCMDTYKEKQTLDDMYARGEMPWKLWE